jgi:hypothetical protein
MSVETVLLVVLALSVAVGLFAFLRGDDARRRAQGQQGPRPAPSIGEAVRLANQRGGRALILFVGDDPASTEAARALAEDPEVLRVLSQPDLAHAVVRSGGDERQVAEVLYEKYVRRPLPKAGPSCVLLDGRGQSLATADAPGALPTWLPGWLSDSPRAMPGAETPRSS